MALRPSEKPAGMVEMPLSISQLTAQIKNAIRTGLPARIRVKAELSGFRPNASSGHAYFTLKDPHSCINCMMFADHYRRVKFDLADGMELLASGRVDVFPAQGKYQFYVDSLLPLGQGALELAFRQLRQKLEREGLFSRERKRALPPYPRRLVLVTSQGAAAMHDILKVLAPFRFLKVQVYHVNVQGETAAAQIAAAITHLSRIHIAGDRVDAILLARGGGSLEDLWSFNEEIVARAIFASAIPIITGIGHEVDVSIADLVADHHAHTPTEAAQKVVAEWKAVKVLLGQQDSRLRRSLRQKVADCRQQLSAIVRHEMFRRPLDRVHALEQLLDERDRSLIVALEKNLNRQNDRLARVEARFGQRHPRHTILLHRNSIAAAEKAMRLAIRNRIRRIAEKFAGYERHLKAVSPEQVLSRGYTITMDRKGQVVRSATSVAPGQQLATRFVDGTVQSAVLDPKQPRLF